MHSYLVKILVDPHRIAFTELCPETKSSIHIEDVMCNNPLEKMFIRRILWPQKPKSYALPEKLACNLKNLELCNHWVFFFLFSPEILEPNAPASV